MSDNQASETKRMPAHLKSLRADPDSGREIDFQSPGERAPAVEPKFNRRRWIGLTLGIVLAIVVYLIMPADVPHNAKLTAATAVLMGAWWMTEAIPLPGTALMPLIIFPTLGEEIEIKDVGAAYGNDVIFLFMGGFLLALAMQRWNLHRRIALLVVRAMGPKPGGMIAGFMIATGFLSMWVSNTATAVMMLPIGISVLILVAKLTAGKDPAQLEAAEAAASAATEADPETEADPVDGDTKTDAVQAITKTNFGTALMLGIAYAASVGSLGTLIGTPPNTLLAGYMRESHNVEIGFGEWMLVGVPLAVLMTFAVWFLLTKVLFKPEIKEIPGGRELMNEELEKLGPMSTGEKMVGAIFVLAALSWVFIPVFWKGLISDAGIAMAVGFLLFVLPAGANRGVRLLDWATAVKLPWGVLLLFGGGLALSAQFSGSGLTEWIGESVSGTIASAMRPVTRM
ncbi:SLC13 family permease [Micrococcoides hystricis]|uniref:Sodium-dependent dicarboxylate transporter SdcS n=1 Tax=Micrococcoides hystricis TaxID=1572761 RepID=A0ABV6PEU6_9MICC